MEKCRRNISEMNVRKGKTKGKKTSSFFFVYRNLLWFLLLLLLPIWSWCLGKVYFKVIEQILCVLCARFLRKCISFEFKFYTIDGMCWAFYFIIYCYSFKILNGKGSLSTLIHVVRLRKKKKWKSWMRYIPFSRRC